MIAHLLTCVRAACVCACVRACVRESGSFASAVAHAPREVGAGAAQHADVRKALAAARGFQLQSAVSRVVYHVAVDMYQVQLSTNAHARTHVTHGDGRRGDVQTR
eukprot:2433167-Pleurochrysis_carterae.AAC.2